MHRIDDPSAAPGNLFTEGVPGSTPATVVTDDIMNAIQEEIAGYIESRGVVLNKPDNTQLQDAIEQHFSTSIANTGGFTNMHLNPGFRFWQAQDPTGETVGVSGQQVADMWYGDAGAAAGTATVSRQNFTTGQTDVPHNPRHYLRWDQTVNGDAPPFLRTAIEDVRRFAGNQVTVSFWARCDTGTRNVTVNAISFYGAAGTPVTNSDAFGTVEINTTWTRYELTGTVVSLSGVTIDSSEGVTTHSALRFELEMPGAATYQIDYANFQVEIGSTASEFTQLPPGLALQFLRRYYEKTYDLGVLPGTSSNNGTATTLLYDGSGVNAEAQVGFEFLRRKAFGPSMTIWTPTATSGSAFTRDSTGSLETRQMTPTQVSRDGFSVLEWDQVPTGGTGFYEVEFHYVADSRLV